MERTRARAAHARARAARAGHPRAAAAHRRDARAAARAPTATRRSARRCWTRRSSPASGTCGSPRRSGGAALALAAPRRRPRGGAPRGARDGRLADARVGRRRARRERASTASPAGRARAAARAIRALRPGRREPHRLLVPGCQRGRGAARGVTARVRARARAASLRVPARVLPRRVRGRARRAGAVRVRGARDAQRAVALRVPAARPRLRRGAGAHAAPPARRAQRDRRPQAGAGRRDLRAVARRSQRYRRRRALPLDPPPDAHLDGGALRRLRLERRRVRRRLRAISRRRSSERRARTSRSRRVVGLSAGSAVDLGGGIRCGPPPPGSSRSSGPRRTGSCRREFGRDVDRLLRARAGSASSAPTRATPPDAAAELADAVTALRLATAGAIAAGPVVFERLDFRPLRISPLLPIAASQPRGRGDAARPRPRRDRRRPALPAPARRRGSRARRGARPLGALALRRGAVPLGAAPRGAHLPAGRRGRRLGGLDAGSGAPRRQDRLEARSASTRSRGAGRRPRRATRSGGRSSRRSLYGDRASLVTALDDTLLGLRARPTSVLRVA